MPIIVSSQLTLELKQQSNKYPIIPDFIESSALENNSDLVIFIHQDDACLKDSLNKEIVEFIVRKNGNTSQKTVRLAFLEQYTKFENLVL